MVSVPVTGDLTGDVTGSPPNVATGQVILGDTPGTFDVNNWAIATPAANGTATIDADTGEWTYTVDPTFFDSLDFNQIATDTFVIQGSDGFFFGQATITISIQGVCFTAGTLIETETGPEVVEALTVGDLVQTKDHGLQPIRWIEASPIPPERLRRDPDLRPVRILRGSLGPDTPSRDLLVSQQHRVLIQGPKVELLFGAAEVLVAAKHLCSWPGIFVDTSDQPVEYLHILLDQHEILIAEGALAESLFLGDEALHSLSSEGLQELASIFPDRTPEKSTGFGRAARMILREHEARALA